jgi:hypothetical protein
MIISNKDLDTGIRTQAVRGPELILGRGLNAASAPKSARPQRAFARLSLGEAFKLNGAVEKRQPPKKIPFSRGLV